MSFDSFLADITSQLDAWGVHYTETTDGLRTDTITLTATSEYPITATVTQGDTTVGVTSSADRAAALIAWPLYRAAWDAGYCSDVEVEVYPDTEEVELVFSYGIEDVAILGGYDWTPGEELTVSLHPLLRDEVVMTDLSAVLEAAEYAHQTPAEAWQILCGAVDYEQSSWETIVETLCEPAHITRGDRLARATGGGDQIALVDDYDPESPVRVIDVDTLEDAVYRSHQDVAAAVLAIIA